MKKLLCVSEFSNLETGYARYYRNVLERLHATGKFELAELACYGVKPEDRDKARNIKWRVYPVLPQNTQEEQVYNSNPVNQFGAYKFEQTCLDFLPTNLIEIRDPWHYKFIIDSPFRKFYSFLLMPTVDAYSTNPEWLDIYEQADRLFLYNDWSYDILTATNRKFPPILGTAPPCASQDFVPLPNKEERKRAILGRDCFVIGMVARNQPRKAFPELFTAFKKLLEETGRTDVYLYCHTNIPDAGWNIPDMLKNSGIANRVFFTYQCKDCKFVFPSIYQDIAIMCPKCHGVAGTSATRLPITDSQLCEIYNLFDIYVQYSYLEGFGMCVVEAAACGLPLVIVDYSAMADTVRKLGGYPINCITYTKEASSGRLFGQPDIEQTVKYLKEFLLLPSETKSNIGKESRRLYEKHYNWDETAKKWLQAIETTNPELSWKSPPRFFNPNTNVPQGLNNKDYVRWLILNVLGQPEKMYSLFEAKLVKDVSFNCTSGQNGAPQPYSRKMAFDTCMNMRAHINHWENQRKLRFGL